MTDKTQDVMPAIPDMTDAECATAYRDLRRRANDAGFATVGEWIDWRRAALASTKDSDAVLEERAAIVAFMREEAKAQMRICENNARFYGYETAAKAQMFAARYEALADAISRGDHLKGTVNE